MSFLSNFENDIFISYAHIDDEPLVKGQDGWITKFHHAFETRYRQLWGSAPKIWRDKRKMHGNDYIEETLVSQVSKNAILVSILSPRYLEREWCLREVEEFCKTADQTGGFKIANKARIFIVEKTYIPPEIQIPRELQNLGGYRFYQLDPENERAHEFSQDHVSYAAKLEDIIYEIHHLLETLKNRQEGPPDPKQPLGPIPPVPASGTSVYLAETTRDLEYERDQIKRELQRRGHNVLPDNKLPLYAPEFEAAVRENLESCKFSIHLVGENYGTIPEAAERSVVCLQNDIAAERCQQDSSFLRLIWMPVGLAAREERQQQFIKSLQNDSEAQQGAELLQTTFEELKTYIQDKLTVKEKPKQSGESDRLYIYLICDQQDYDAVAPLESYLYDQGYEVILPAMGGDEAQVRDDHKQNLLHCDAIMMYYGQASEFWLRTKLRDLQKIAGYGRTKPMRAKAIYMSAPDTFHKQRFRTHEAMLIKNFNDFSPDSLSSFLLQLENVGRAKGGQR